VGVAKERERQAIRDPMRQIATFGLEPGRLPRTAGIADPCPWDPGAMVAKMLPQFGASPAEASGAQELGGFGVCGYGTPLRGFTSASPI
jgi:hypothetical protein